MTASSLANCFIRILSFIGPNRWKYDGTCSGLYDVTTLHLNSGMVPIIRMRVWDIAFSCQRNIFPFFSGNFSCNLCLNLFVLHSCFYNSVHTTFSLLVFKLSYNITNILFIYQLLICIHLFGCSYCDFFHSSRYPACLSLLFPVYFSYLVVFTPSSFAVLVSLQTDLPCLSVCLPVYWNNSLPET